MLNIRLVLGEGRSKVTGLFSVAESQTNEGLASRLFVRDANDKVSRRIKHGLDVVLELVRLVDDIDAAEGKELGSLVSILCVGEDQE